jgi:hypothetical protein
LNKVSNNTMIKNEGSAQEDKENLTLGEESIQFECRVWAYRKSLRPAPRKPWGFTALKMGRIAATSEQTITLSVRGLRTREIDPSDVIGFTYERLPARRQLTNKIFEFLFAGAVVGLIIAVSSFFLIGGASDLSPLDFITNFFVLFAVGLAPVFVGGLLWSIPTILRIRTLALFTLKFRDGRMWDFGVLERQLENVIHALESFGMKKLTNGIYGE